MKDTTFKKLLYFVIIAGIITTFLLIGLTLYFYSKVSIISYIAGGAC